MNESSAIRPATPADLDVILSIYETARRFMRANGNLNQWVGGYPAPALLLDDIKKGHLFVCLRDGVVRGVFLFMTDEPEPTYAVIDGKWLSNESYGTIHRIAGDGVGGIFTQAFEFCRARANHLRIDTHADNYPMQHVVTKHGFVHCGTIYLENGDPRLAYEWIAPLDNSRV